MLFNSAPRLNMVTTAALFCALISGTNFCTNLGLSAAIAAPPSPEKKILRFKGPSAFFHGKKVEIEFMEDRWDAPERVLEFPADSTVGTLLIHDDWRNRGRNAPSRLIQARGKVVIPKNKFVIFRASKDFFKNPKLIQHLQPNAFDGVELKLMSMDDSEDALCDSAIAHLSHLKGLRLVILDKSEVTDEGMKHLAALPNLEYISGFLTPIRGTCFKDLKSLKKLMTLSLDSDGLRDEEFKYLPDLPNLQVLMFSRANVTNRGMRHLAGCKKLRWLDVGKNPGISDDSIQHIKAMKNLVHLEVQNTSITGAGLLQLKDSTMRDLTISSGALSAQQMAELKKTVPDMQLSIRDQHGTVDEETGTIFGQMSRQRRF